MFFVLWLKRFFLSRHQFIRFTPLVSIFSLILASSSLVLAMSVYSGYETTVKQAIVDMVGHLVITGRQTTTEKDILSRIKTDLDHTASYLPFLSLKSLLVYDGKLSGVLLEGIPPEKAHQTLQLKKRLIAGAFHLKDQKAAIIGRGVAKRFKLKPGDFFHIVIPKMDSEGAFQNKHQKLYVEGVLDLGFHDFNLRHILVNINTVQSLVHQPEAISGMRFLMNNPDQTEMMRVKLTKILGPSYRVDDWQTIISSVHESYFQAVRREKFLIFFILMVLVLAGAFNVSSHLSISVLNQLHEISILKVMGAGKFFIYSLLLVQGFIISSVGTLIGMGVGWVFSRAFVSFQSVWQIIPSDVYKINTIITELRWSDIVLIFVCSQLICIISCLLPAWRALQLSLREGLLCE